MRIRTGVAAAAIGIAAACVGSDPATGDTPGPVDDAGGGGADSGGSSSGSTPSPALLTLAPVTYRYPNTKPVSTSAPHAFTVTNSGGSPSIQIGPAALTSGPTGAFAVSQDGCKGKVLAGGESCAVEVTFTPPTTGEETTTLQVAQLAATITGVGSYWVEEDAKGAELASIWGERVTGDAGTTTVLYAAGKLGKVLSSNGDGTWKDEMAPNTGDLLTVFGIRSDSTSTGAGTLYAAGLGPRIVRKAPGASSWSQDGWPVAGLFTNARALWIRRAPTFTAYLFGDGGKYAKWESGGGPGVPITPTSALPTIYGASGVTALGDDMVCAAGSDGKVYGFHPSAPDGGPVVTTATTVPLRGVWVDYPTVTTRVFVVGDDGNVFHAFGCLSSTNWIKDTTNTSARLNGVWASATESWVVGEDGTILHRSGLTGPYEVEATGTKKHLRAVWGFDSEIWAVGDGVILHRK